ncbi:MAG: hypothetical protein CME64_04615 [Halobacteriovoraceae bacterium]|nr:hypothetical protein [Halobacteriovoraceae bacterium]|tara:strand:+ start:210624 stop:211109 length:486 start_codon:yes stop_codon:yes gene_type:complete
MKFHLLVAFFIASITSAFSASFEPLCKYQEDWRVHYKTDMSMVHEDLSILNQRDRLPNGCDFDFGYISGEPAISYKQNMKSKSLIISNMNQVLGKDKEDLVSCVTGGRMEKYARKVNNYSRNLILHYSPDGSQIEIIEMAAGYSQHGRPTRYNQISVCLNQ